MGDGGPARGASARPELRVRVTQRTHDEMVSRASAAGLSLTDYTRAVIVNAIVGPDDRVRVIEHMQSEIERLQAIVGGLRTEAEELTDLRKERAVLHRKIARLEPLATVARVLVNAVKKAADLVPAEEGP